MKLPGTRVAQAIAALIFAAGIAAALWIVVIAPRQARTEAVVSRAQTTMAEGQTQAAREALEITVKTQDVKAQVDVRTSETNRAIYQAPDARIDPALADAGLRALCVQHNRNDPVCERLLHDDGRGIGAR